MKIVYNITTTATPAGGMERVVVQKANFMAEHFGHEVLIITTDQKDTPSFYPYAPGVRHIDLRLDYMGLSKEKWFIRAYLRYRNTLRKHRRMLTEVLMREKADIVVSMSRDEKEFLYKIKDGSKKVLESHRCLKPRARIELKRSGSLLKKLKIVYRLLHETHLPVHYDSFVVLTEEDKQWWLEKPNVRVIPNPLPFTTNRVSSLDTCRILSIGRISRDKGIDRMLDIWSRIAPCFPEWKLTLIGDVVDHDLIDRINISGLAQSVEVLPTTPHVFEAYQKSSIYIMTSRFEGLPMVLLEAVACGLPIVSYAFKCGPRDVINDGKDGYLIEEDDADMFVKRLSELMGNDALRQRMGSQAKINSERFSMLNVMTRWNDLFIGLTGKENG
jgi:glycosyltransferase involved in cell wall biosynthesis